MSTIDEIREYDDQLQGILRKLEIFEIRDEVEQQLLFRYQEALNQRNS